MNLPNKLTLMRIVLVPVFMVFAGLGQIGTPACNRMFYLVAAIVFAVASFTDYLHGHLARKWNIVTDFGKFADPLADKLLTTTAFLYMMHDGVCSPVVLVIILYYVLAAFAPADAIGAVSLISMGLCWLVAAVTLISGAKYLWDNRSFINTAK